MTDASSRSRLRRNWPWLACVLVVVVTAGVLTVATLRTDKYETAVGKVVYTEYTMPTVYHSYVRLPFGQVQVSLTRPRHSIDDYQLGPRPAPDNGSFVGIETRFVKQYVVPGTASASSTPLPVRFELIAGTHTYSVPVDPLVTRTSGNPIPPLPRAWVAVDGVPDDVRVAVSYDGVRQLIEPKTGRRDAGRAAQLYSHPLFSHPLIEQPSVAKSCGRPRLSSGYRAVNNYDFTCMFVSLPRLPYVAGAGWAPAGKSWLTVYVSTDRDVGVDWRGRDGRTGRYYSVADDITATLRLGDAAGAGNADTNSTDVRTSDSGGSGQVGFFALASTTSAVTLHATVTYHRLVNTDYRVDPDAPVDPTIQATWTVQVR